MSSRALNLKGNSIYRHFPDIAFSLCGGLDAESETFSSTLFEQSLLSYDDFVMTLKNNEDIFSNPDLVVRIGDKYYTWSAACPVIMSGVLYGRALPSELVKAIQGSFPQETRSKESSPNSKAARSSWWPFGSRKEADENSAKLEEGAAAPVEGDNKAVEAKVEITVETTPTTSESPSKKAEGGSGKFDSNNNGSSTSSEGDSDHDLKLAMPPPQNSISRDKKYKKTLRLSSDAIVRLFAMIMKREIAVNLPAVSEPP